MKAFTVAAVTIVVCMLLTPVAIGPITETLNPRIEPNSDEAEALGPLIVIPLLMIAFSGGMIVQHIREESKNSGLPNAEDEYEEQAKDFEAYFGSVTALLKNGLDIDTQTVQFTQYYWDRVAEVAVSDLWRENTNIDTCRVLDRSSVSENLAMLYRSWESVIDTPFEKLSQMPALNAAAGYGEMDWGLYIGDTKLAANSSFSFDSATLVDASNGGKAYLNTTTGEGATSLMEHIRVFSTLTMVSESGNRITLSPGDYPLEDFAEGYYTMIDGLAAGPFMSVGSGSASMQATLIANVDGTSGYVVKTDGGYDLIFNGTTYSGTDIGLYAEWPKDSGTGYTSKSVAGLLDSWVTLNKQFDVLVSNAVESAKAIWMLYDHAGSSNTMVTLSGLIPDLSNMTLTAEQKYALGVASLMQASEWYQNSAVQLSGSDLRISAESMDLFVKGTIKDASGNVLAENVVFTPFCYLDSMTISTSGVDTWSQPGFAVVWDSVDTWNGTADVANMQLITMSSGMTMELDSITYKGNNVDTMTLQVKSMELVLSDYAETPDPSPMPTSKNYSMLVTVIMVLAALILAYVAIRTGSPWMLIIAVALAAVGWLWPDTILGWIF